MLIDPDSGGDNANSQFAEDGAPAVSTAIWRSCCRPVCVDRFHVPV